MIQDKRISRKRFGLLGFSLLTIISCLAIPARRDTLIITQPDGSTIEARMHGDEFHHYFTDKEGKPLVKDKAGMLRPSDLPEKDFISEMSRQSANSPRRNHMRSGAYSLPEGRGYGLMPEASFPTTGAPRALVLLVEYSDVKFNLSDPGDYFRRMLNEPGFSEYDGTGSALDFFVENSGGLFNPAFDVLGPVTLPNNRAYYGANDGRGDDRLAHMMVVDGCRILDPEVDFSVYDNDGDGVVDNVFVFFAGEAESSTGIEDQVWPHTYFLSYASSIPYIHDGVRLDRYACSNEWNGAYRSRPARPDGVGTFVHEFSHVLGLPDLYSITYNSAFTPGPWSTLDYGPYNNNGCTPPNYSVFERYALGWLQPREIIEAANVRLEPITQNMAAMIPTDKETEFFLFENRQQSGWDAYLPGHGMLVWHVDYEPGVWSSNTVNTTVAHQYVDLEEADGMGTEETRADDAFPSTLGRTSFTDSTIPSMMPWTGRSVGLPVTDIAESEDGIITFKVAGGRPDVEIPAVAEATEIFPGGFTANWSEVNVPDCNYALSVYTRTGPGARGIVYVPQYRRLNVGRVTSFRVDGLEPDTQYYYSVSTVIGNESSDPSSEMGVHTAPPTFDYLKPVILEASEVSHDSFVANWESLEGATDYRLFVSTLMPDGKLMELCDFTGGLTNLPKGWSTSATSTYSMSGNAGQSIPSLRFTRDEQFLRTPILTDGISEISFWTRGIGTDTDAHLTLEGIDNAGETHILSAFPVSTVSGGTAYQFSEIPDNILSFRLVASLTTGSIALDDVKILHGTAYSPMPLDNYNGISCNDGLSMKVTGLVPQTEYYYRVAAFDGELTSRSSESVTVRTLEESGIVSLSGRHDISISIIDNKVCLYGLCNGDKVSVADVAGIQRASVLAQSPQVYLALPTAGIYIISINGKPIYKIAIHI